MKERQEKCLCYRSAESRAAINNGLEFEELIRYRVKAPMERRRGFFHDKSGHVFEGWVREVQEMTSIIQ